MKKLIIAILLLILVFFGGYEGYFIYSRYQENNCSIKIETVSAQIINRQQPDKVTIEYKDTIVIINNKELYNQDIHLMVKMKLKTYTQPNKEVYKKELSIN